MKMKKERTGLPPVRSFPIRSVLPAAAVAGFTGCQWGFIPVGVPDWFAPGLPRLLSRREEFEGVDVENQFPGQCVIITLVGFRLAAAADQQFHAFGDVLLEFFSPFSPHLGTDPIGEFAFTNAPGSRDVDVENGHFTSVKEFHAADISNY